MAVLSVNYLQATVLTTLVINSVTAHVDCFKLSKFLRSTCSSPIFIYNEIVHEYTEKYKEK